PSAGQTPYWPQSLASARRNRNAPPATQRTPAKPISHASMPVCASCFRWATGLIGGAFAGVAGVDGVVGVDGVEGVSCSGGFWPCSFSCSGGLLPCCFSFSDGCLQGLLPFPL